MNIIYCNNPPESIRDVTELLRSCDWSEWQQAEVVFDALKKSSHITIAIDTDCENKCVGIARSMDDGAWSANIDCVLIHPSYQGKGIGANLLGHLLEQIGHIMYISVAPNEASVVPFYEKCGFTYIADGALLQRVNMLS